MTRIFLDTEFIEDGKTITPISIGLVREDSELYVEFGDTDLSKVNPWVKANVIPNLKGTTYTPSYPSPIYLINNDNFNLVLPKENARDEIFNFVESSANEPEFWGYFCDYDWVLICQLFGTMLDLPKGWPMFCLDVKQEMHMNGHTSESISAEIPQPTTHNALDDARWIKLAHEFICL